MSGTHEVCGQAKWKAHRRRQMHRNKGLCLECTRNAVVGRRFCLVHLAKARAKAKEEYEWRVANGICVKCGVPKEEERRGVNCISCAHKAAAREQLRRVLDRRSISLIAVARDAKGGSLELTSTDDKTQQNKVA